MKIKMRKKVKNLLWINSLKGIRSSQLKSEEVKPRVVSQFIIITAK